MQDNGAKTDWQRGVQQAYDRVAGPYAIRLFTELDHKPFDRSMLDRLAQLALPLGPVCDLGCGPGQIARFLHDRWAARGLEVFGIDLSREMIEQARRLSPGLRFEQGTMLGLDLDDASLGGVAAFYSIVNVPRDVHPLAFAEIWRVLRPGGWLLLAFHVGDEDVHLEEWWETPVSVDFYFLDPAEIAAKLRTAGFSVDEEHVREPYPAVEHPSRRAYLLARKLSSVRS